MDESYIANIYFGASDKPKQYDSIQVECGDKPGTNPIVESLEDLLKELKDPESWINNRRV